MSVSTEAEEEEEEPTADAARKVVYEQKNSKVNPAVATAEVAEELGVSVERAYDLLHEHMTSVGHIRTKQVAGDGPEHHIWW